MAPGSGEEKLGEAARVGEVEGAHVRLHHEPVRPPEDPAGKEGRKGKLHPPKATKGKAREVPGLLAERAGFEPAIELPLYHLSKMAH